MAIINSYPTVTPTGGDLIIGTDVSVEGNPTKTFTIDSLLGLASTSYIKSDKIIITTEELKALHTTPKILVDVTAGTMPITWESVRILREKGTPFIIAANKIDRISGWKSVKDADFLDSYNKQKQHVKDFLDEKIYQMMGDFLEEGFKDCDRYDRIKDFTKKLAIVPTSAKTGEGISTLLLILMGLVQQYLTKNLKFSEGPAKGVVLEVKKEKGQGKTMDVLIYDGVIKKGDEFIVGGLEKPIKSKVRALLIPKPLDEIRDPRQKFDSAEVISAAAGIKILAPNIDDVVAGSPFKVIGDPSLEESVYNEIEEEVDAIKIKTDKAGVVLKVMLQLVLLM